MLGLPNAKPGDWECPKCGHLCFASKGTCFRCGAYKPHQSNQHHNSPMKSGGWMCSCGEHNFASRQVCRKCNNDKPKSSTKPEVKAQPGDWDCSCGEMNFGTRTACRKCGKEREIANKPKSECTVCLDRQPDTRIHPCGHVAMCYQCASIIAMCPICRQSYTPNDIQRVFLV